MKKLIFGLIATVMFNFSGYSISNLKLEINKNESKIEQVKGGKIQEHKFFCDVRPKTGLYYAVADAAGGYSGFQMGSFLGPLGMSAGMVFGAIGCSAWNYYWDNKNNLIPINGGKDSFSQSFVNNYEENGFLHNQFILEFINKNQTPYRDANSFVDDIYEPVCIELSNHFKIDLELIKKNLDKAQLIEIIKNNTEDVSGLNDIDALVKKTTASIQRKYGNKTLSSHFEKVVKQIQILENNGDFDINKFINTEISSVENSNEFTKEEKEIIYNSMNILKYSYSLWNNN